MDAISNSLTILLTEQWDYLVAWMIYLGATLLGFVIFWHWTRPLRWPVLRDLLRTLVALLLLLPTPSAPEQAWLAPAIMAVAMHVLNGDMAAVGQVVDPLIPVVCLVFALVLSEHLVRHLRGGNTPPPGSGGQPSDRQQAAAETNGEKTMASRNRPGEPPVLTQVAT